ncbi:uncharacterized protein N7506_000960 [Penicillium brevicompactum]|uniref:uncharacterized protein n=1 Tax=Penicillium brevicompactum TaxID=5074 RepID=UPI0025411F93|nr:uncharacterized protein N7506_000960 [Penicillium brevicompactum]KAJ5347707.1 hypothetical protein N7506_000960 [Penicillium brevicompactum]
MRAFSDHPIGELPELVPDFSQCNKADLDAYRRIFIDSDPHNLEYTFKLLMNIVKRPCLGHLVERIEYIHIPTNYEDWPNPPYQRDLATDDLDLLRRAVRNAGFKDRKEHRIMSMLMQNNLEQDFRQTPTSCFGFSDFGIARTFVTQAIAAMIVSLSPNLESMAMTQIFDHHLSLEEGKADAIDYPLVQVFQFANSRSKGTTHFLQKLRDVYLINFSEDNDDRFYVRFDLMAALGLFNKLPSIESFGIDVFEPDDNSGFQQCEFKSSNISIIRINHSLLSSDYLLCVMAASKVITEIQFTAGGRTTLDGGYLFNPKAFLKGLAEHKKTLKVLDINTDEYLSHFPGGPGDFEVDMWEEDELDENNSELIMHNYFTSIWDRHVSLKDLVALEHLSIGIGFLIYLAQGVEVDDATRASVMLVDCLPDSLEYLSIQGYQPGENRLWDTQIKALMARFESGSLRLKEINGVNECIPIGNHIENPDEDSHLLWSLEKRGFPESWGL